MPKGLEKQCGRHVVGRDRYLCASKGVAALLAARLGFVTKGFCSESDPKVPNSLCPTPAKEIRHGSLQLLAQIEAGAFLSQFK